MIAVALTLGVLAAMALMLSMSGGTDSALVTGHAESETAGYIAESGMAHAEWRLANSASCTGYTSIQSTPFGAGSYSANRTPDTGTTV